MNHQNTLTTCSTCLHKTTDSSNQYTCLISGNTTDPNHSCDNYYHNRTHSAEVAQFDFETEKEYFTMKLIRLFTIYLTGLILGTVFLFMGYSNPGNNILMMVISTLVIFVSVIASIVLLYNLWKFTIDQLKKHGLSPAIDSPGKAVGFLFIPFFNFYWIFMAFGKLPVEINRIAIARTGNRIIVNDIGVVLSITTILSIIPVFGIILVLINSFFLPFYYGLVISAVKNLPYTPESIPTLEKPQAEPLEMDSIRDYSQLFDSKHYGTNFLFGIYYFAAVFISQGVSTVIFYLTHDIPLIHYFSGNNLVFSIVSPLFFTIALVIMSHTIRNKWLLALITGLILVVANVISNALLLILDNFDSNIIFNKSYIIHLSTNFISGVLFILSLSAFIRIFGLKFWSIALAIFATSVITHSSFYVFSYAFSGSHQFELTSLIGMVFYILTATCAIYLAFYQYVKRTETK